MTGNVVGLGKAEIHSVRREAFLQAVATTFERYVAQFGHEPDAIAYVLNGLKQPSITAWEVCGESEGGASACLALAGAGLLAEIGAERVKL